MKRRYRIALYAALSVIGLLLALVAGLFGLLQTGYARDQLRQQIADATAGSATGIGAVAASDAANSASSAAVLLSSVRPCVASNTRARGGGASSFQARAPSISRSNADAVFFAKATTTGMAAGVMHALSRVTGPRLGASR